MGPLHRIVRQVYTTYNIGFRLIRTVHNTEKEKPPTGSHVVEQRVLHYRTVSGVRYLVPCLCPLRQSMTYINRDNV